MNEKDDEIAHFLIVRNPDIAWGCAAKQQFARNKSRIGRNPHVYSSLNLANCTCSFPETFL